MRQRALSGGFAALAMAAFVWAFALSVSPELHGRIHPDQNRADHSCAVTFVRSGNYHHATAPVFDHAGQTAVEFATVPALSPCWVASPFLRAAIFEHAPPDRA
jgi:hypothetical protein